MTKKRQLSKSNGIRVAPLLVILFFAIMGVVGIALGEPAKVLELAFQVCLSCIGIG